MDDEVDVGKERGEKKFGNSLLQHRRVQIIVEMRA